MIGKRFTRPRHTWILPLGEGAWYIRIRMFKDRKAMLRAYTEYAGVNDELDPLTRAVVLEGPFMFKPRGGRQREMKRELAHVLMHCEDVTTFLVAHEFLHVALYWKRKMHWRLRRRQHQAGSLEERLCDMAGLLTRKFWNRCWQYGLCHAVKEVE